MGIIEGTISDVNCGKPVLEEATGIHCVWAHFLTFTRIAMLDITNMVARGGGGSVRTLKRRAWCLGSGDGHGQ